MRGSLWTLLVAGIGAALFLMTAVPAAMPSTPSSSTTAASSVLAQTTPFMGLLLTIAAIGALLTLAFKL